MPVDDPDVIDAIGLDIELDEAVLTVADAVAWDQPMKHLLVLQEKINRYLEFIQDGGLLARYPAAEDKPVRIDVVFRYPPPAVADAFLDRAREIVEGGGWRFTWRLVANPGSGD